ncbi:hypothetical protein BU16DRAFT_541910 [Lophium mytilinum]|uniref:Pathway-specific nitrogen regulator n=1 Tax=Lophium mytilinum TaxID=390894 RepID=A0A6A6QHR5_9PEZI|nr:hypothetical protein BU16DRAFT_541910 [Lophium mytilinum]
MTTIHTSPPPGPGFSIYEDTEHSLSSPLSSYDADTSFSSETSSLPSPDDPLESIEPHLDNSDAFSTSTTRSRRVSALTTTSLISDLPSELSITSRHTPNEMHYTPMKERALFRNPSSVRALQMASPPPFEPTYSAPRAAGTKGAYKLSTPSRRSETPSRHSVRSQSLKPGQTPTPSKQLVQVQPPPPQFHPLILLHVTLLPLAHVYSPGVLAAMAPAWLGENYRLLEERFADSVLMQRGLLIPHPNEEYDLLEERLLESLELKMPRLLKCGHFTGGEEAEESDVSDEEDEGRGSRMSGGTITGEDEEVFECDDASSVCTDCHRPIRKPGKGAGSGSKKWNIKIYAANGLMRAGAWGAAWREMERVDVEISPWIPEDIRKALEQRQKEEEQEELLERKRIQEFEELRKAEALLEEKELIEAEAASIAAEEKRKVEALAEEQRQIEARAASIAEETRKVNALAEEKRQIEAEKEALAEEKRKLEVASAAEENRKVEALAEEKRQIEAEKEALAEEKRQLEAEKEAQASAFAEQLRIEAEARTQASILIALDTEHPERPRSRSKRPTSSSSRQAIEEIPLSTLLKNYIYLMVSDQRNIAIAFLSAFVIFLSLQLHKPPQTLIPGDIPGLILSAPPQECAASSVIVTATSIVTQLASQDASMMPLVNSSPTPKPTPSSSAASSILAAEDSSVSIAPPIATPADGLDERSPSSETAAVLPASHAPSAAVARDHPVADSSADSQSNLEEAVPAETPDHDPAESSSLRSKLEHPGSWKEDEGSQINIQGFSEEKN